MNYSQIIALQKRVGATPDGFWGPRSIAACQAHLRKLMPKESPWPATDQKSLTDFYGKAGDESRLVTIGAPKATLYEGAKVKSIRVNDKCAASLGRVLAAIADSPFSYVLEYYAGTYNNRPMRAGSLPSLHARGAAIDLDPDSNANRQAWPAAATMPIEVMEFFAREGWLSAGAFWGRDAMHFQATR